MPDREFTNINGIKVCDQTARDNIPTKTSQLENDNDYVTTTQLNQAIDNAQLGGGEVDLSGYVTKETGNANQITFADGQTFQAKLDNGTLKGEKGDKGAKGDTGATGAKGDKGQDGLTTAISVNGTTYIHSNGTITLPNYPTVVSTADGITIADTAGNFTATNVEGALAELFQFVNTVAEELRQISSGGTGERPLYKFGLLSDVHIDGDGNDEAHSISDLNNAISFLENAGANFIAYCGDMTRDGYTEDYTALKTCLETSTVPNYCIRGNHDAFSLSDGYASATGCENDYIVTQGNDLLIFISCADTNHDTGGLTTSKLDWLENLLQTNTNTRVFLFYHYFVDGTSGNGTGVYPYGTLKPSNATASRFINMVKQYPNLIYCNGHSHMRFNIQDQDANANYYHNNGECYYIHVPSTAKPRFPNGDTVADYYEGSEGYLVEVYANKVIFKPIDFIASEYLTKYNYTANVSQGNNAPTVPSEPTEPSEPTTPTIAWNDGVKIDKSTGAETSDTNYSASNFIACDSSKTYTLNLTSSLSSYSASVFICYYDKNKSFISCSSNYVGLYHSDSEVLTTELSIPSNAKYIKLRLSSSNVGGIDKSVITLTHN